MNKKTIIIEIDVQGNSSIDLVGFAGKGCAKVAADFRGPDIIKLSRNKPEYSVEQPAQQKAGVQQ